METEIPILDMLPRLSVATGLRSHMLVSLGSATFIIIGMSVLFATAEGDPSARIDPTRVVEGVFR